MNILKLVYRKIWTIYALRKVKSHGKNVCVNRRCKFSANTVIGDNCHFNGMKITGDGNVNIGDNFHSGGGCLLITSNHNYDFGKRIPYDETYITKDIVIGENVWIGENVTILSGVTIGEGVIVQAGSVVVSDLEPCSIAGGHPARVFKKRDEEHYYELKKNKMFF